MKIRELLRESSTPQITQDLQDLLISIKGRGVDSVDTTTVVNQLSRMGHSATTDTVLQVIAEMPMAVSADESTITLGDEPADVGGEESADDSADKVSKMAKKAADKEL